MEPVSRRRFLVATREAWLERHFRSSVGAGVASKLKLKRLDLSREMVTIDCYWPTNAAIEL